MNIGTQIKTFITELDKKNFHLFLGVTLAAVGLLTGFIIYFSLSEINTIQENIDDINMARTKVQRMIGRYNKVKQQQRIVDKLIAKKELFKMPYYFESLLEEVGLSQNLKGELKPESARQDKNYTEVSLVATLSRISMRQLTDLLQKIEDNERVYPKRIEINKSKGGAPPAIDVTLTIATLNKTAEVT